jgi:hypothetical protein
MGLPMPQRKVSLLLLCIAASCGGLGNAQPAAPTSGLNTPQWTVFSDSAGTRVAYPAGIFTVEAGPAPRGQGRELRSADGRARMMIYVEHNDRGLSPAQFLRTELRAPSGELDYDRVTARFFAISGIHQGQVYYSRCNFPSRTPGAMIHCIYVGYPEDEQQLWDPIVTRMSLSLRPLR